MKWMKRDISSDEHIFIFEPRFRTICRVITGWLTTALLLIPVVMLANVSSLGLRLGIIFLACGIYLFALVLLTKARTLEVFIAGARYDPKKAKHR